MYTECQESLIDLGELAGDIAVGIGRPHKESYL